jgi:hypothetical protein
VRDPAARAAAGLPAALGGAALDRMSSRGAMPVPRIAYIHIPPFGESVWPV